MEFTPGSFSGVWSIIRVLIVIDSYPPAPQIYLCQTVSITDKNGDTANGHVIGTSIEMQFHTELEDCVPKMRQPSIVRTRQRDNRRTRLREIRYGEFY